MKICHSEVCHGSNASQSAESMNVTPDSSYYLFFFPPHAPTLVPLSLNTVAASPLRYFLIITGKDEELNCMLNIYPPSEN